VTRTYPAGGTFTPEQQAIHDAVFKAQEAVIAGARPGRLWRDLEETSRKVLGEELLALGLIAKTEPDQIRMYALHPVGHPVGLQVHDVFRASRPLEPGMVIAIEPGLYVRKDDVIANPTYQKLSEEERNRVKAALERYAGIGVRIEDNVLITNGAAEMLSSGAPRSAAEIERFLAAARQP
jgi:Xaa-Pro aminopeptidase